jgi:hypothetical protein
VEDTEPKPIDDSESVAKDIELLLLMAAAVLVVLLWPASTQYLFSLANNLLRLHKTKLTRFL